MAVTKKTNNKKIKKEEKVDMGKLQSTICREIKDTADVTKSEVSNEIIANLAESNSREDIKATVKLVSAKIDMQANLLIDRVLKSLK